MTFPRFAPNLDYALFIALVGTLVAGQLIWLRRTRRLQHLHPIAWPLLGVILVGGWGLVESATRTVTESVLLRS